MLFRSINILRDDGVPIHAVEIQNAKYYDTGEKLKYLQTTIDLALQHPDIKDEFSEYLKNLKI